ncbi:MAG: acyl carrier protein [Bacteroidota bacterium]
MKDVVTIIKSIIAEKSGVDEKNITLETKFSDDLGFDSLDIVELLVEFEKEFDIVVDDNEALDIATAGEVIEYIEKKCKEKK